MPGSASPPSGSRRRSPSPRRDRDREERRRSDRDSRDRPSERDRDRHRDRDRDRPRDGDRRDRDRYDDRPRRSHDDRDRDRTRDGDRDRRRDDRPRDDRPPPSGPSANNGSGDSHREPTSSRARSRSRSPPRAPPRRPKELSFYKKYSAGMGSLSSRRDPLDEVEESEKERLQRRERGEVPARFGGTKEQGVRNTMSRNAPMGSAPSGMGSFRRGADPLDRIGSKGGSGDAGYGQPPAQGQGRADGDRARQERVAAMDKPRAVPSGSAAPAGGARPPRFIEVIANSRMGGKVRVKCLPTDTVGDLKKLIAAQTGTTAQKIQLKKWYTNFKDHVTLQDYEINDGMSLEMY